MVSSGLMMATAASQVKRLLDAGCLVIDTETTGLGARDQVIEVAVVDAAGKVLLDTLVRPGVPISAGASAVHGMTDADVARGMPIEELWERLHQIVMGRPMVAYNLKFDDRLLSQTFGRSWGDQRHAWACAMMLWYRHKFLARWVSLDVACQQAGLDPAPPRHRALGDARTALSLLHHMAEKVAEEEEEIDEDGW